MFDNPLSSRFDENDALIYFDDVKVPWDRVFVYRDPDMCRRQFHETHGHVYQNHQAQVRFAVKVKFLLGLARRVTEAIGTTNFPTVTERLGFMAAQASMVDAVVSGIETGGSQQGQYWVPNRHLIYTAQVLFQEMYPQLVNAIRELAGGSLIMLPSSIADFKDPMLSKIVNTTQRAATMQPSDKVKFLKACWDAIGSEFGSRHLQYEMFYTGARYVTTAHSFRTYDWAAASALVDGLLSSYSLDDELPQLGR
jgi:4-hydroxyphenylacetate 3-monooxygenase